MIEEHSTAGFSLTSAMVMVVVKTLKVIERTGSVLKAQREALLIQYTSLGTTQQDALGFFLLSPFERYHFPEGVMAIITQRSVVRETAAWTKGGRLCAPLHIAGETAAWTKGGRLCALLHITGETGCGEGSGATHCSRQRIKWM